MKSVSFALDAAYSTSSTGPITSRSASSSSLVYDEHVVARLERALVAGAGPDRLWRLPASSSAPS